MTETERAKRALRAAATRTEADEDRRVIEAAVAATGDLDDAAWFVEALGVDRLEAAVAAVERRDETPEEGRTALRAFRAFRRAARGRDHFHSGHGTPLGGAGQGRGR